MKHIYRIQPLSNRKKAFVFDQIESSLGYIDYINSFHDLKNKNQKLLRVDIAKMILVNPEWRWLQLKGKKPNPDIAQCNYANFAFNDKSLECLENFINPRLLLPIGDGYSMFYPEEDATSKVYSDKNGQVIVDHEFLDRYRACGLTGLEFCDPERLFGECEK